MPQCLSRWRTPISSTRLCLPDPDPGGQSTPGWSSHRAGLPQRPLLAKHPRTQPTGRSTLQCGLASAAPWIRPPAQAVPAYLSSHLPEPLNLLSPSSRCRQTTQADLSSHDAPATKGSLPGRAPAGSGLLWHIADDASGSPSAEISPQRRTRLAPMRITGPR